MGVTLQEAPEGDEVVTLHDTLKPELPEIKLWLPLEIALQWHIHALLHLKPKEESCLKLSNINMPKILGVA